MLTKSRDKRARKWSEKVAIKSRKESVKGRKKERKLKKRIA